MRYEYNARDHRGGDKFDAEEKTEACMDIVVLYWRRPG